MLAFSSRISRLRVSVTGAAVERSPAASRCTWRIRLRSGLITHADMPNPTPSAITSKMASAAINPFCAVPNPASNCWLCSALSASVRLWYSAQRWLKSPWKACTGTLKNASMLLLAVRPSACSFKA